MLLSAVDVALDVLDVRVLGLGGLTDWFAVDGDIIHDIRIATITLVVHVGKVVLRGAVGLVGVSRIVDDEGTIRGGKYRGVAARVLQALAHENRPAGSRPNDKITDELALDRPKPAAGTPETEYRAEDVSGNHRQVVSHVGRADNLEGYSRIRFGNACIHDLVLLGLLIGEHHLGINGHVVPTVSAEDPRGEEDRIKARGVGLVRGDRDEIAVELLVLGEVLEESHQCHGHDDLERA